MSWARDTPLGKGLLPFHCAAVCHFIRIRICVIGVLGHSLFIRIAFSLVHDANQATLRCPRLSFHSLTIDTQAVRKLQEALPLVARVRYGLTETTIRAK